MWHKLNKQFKDREPARGYTLQKGRYKNPCSCPVALNFSVYLRVWSRVRYLEVPILIVHVVDPGRSYVADGLVTAPFGNSVPVLASNRADPPSLKQPGHAPGSRHFFSFKNHPP